ncbi:MAG: rod shape-determining protein MreC [Bacteroidales bacterium]|nr:rod shape-determining protein MreC [Bacteroidales bacterium]
MKSLLRFLIRYHSTILFLVLEIIAFILIARFNSFHNAKIYSAKNRVLGNITSMYRDFSQYLRLIDENKALRKENIRLYNLLPANYYNPVSHYDTVILGEKKYEFIGAVVINNSTNKQYNYITINKGRKHGIEPEMGVICNDGIVGVVKETTENFSTIVSLLNRDFFPNAMIKRNGFFGYIEWLGRRYNKVVLKEIPLHAEILIGDTITTSGYSGIFPEGILIGVVEKFEAEQGIFYKVYVNLSTNFKRLSNVVVVNNRMREEQLKVEQSTEHD